MAMEWSGVVAGGRGGEVLRSVAMAAAEAEQIHDSIAAVIVAPGSVHEHGR